MFPDTSSGLVHRHTAVARTPNCGKSSSNFDDSGAGSVAGASSRKPP